MSSNTNIVSSEAKVNSKSLNESHDKDFIRDQARQTYNLLFGAGTCVEIRCVKMWGRDALSGYYENADAFAEGASQFSGAAEGVYFTAQSLKPELATRCKNNIEMYGKNPVATKDKEIARYHVLYLDFDPIRKAGVSSSDEELQAALDLALGCRFYLATRGFPEPLYACSGKALTCSIRSTWTLKRSR